MSSKNTIGYIPPPPPPPPPPPKEARTLQQGTEELNQAETKKATKQVTEQEATDAANVVIPEGAETVSAPHSPVQVLQVRGNTQATQTAQASVPQTLLIVESPPVSFARKATGIEFCFEDGCVMELGDNGSIVVSRPESADFGSAINEVYGTDPQVPVSTISFPLVAGQTQGSITYSFLEPHLNLSLAQNTSASAEALDLLVNLGLFFDEDGYPGTTILEALFSNAALTEAALQEILQDEGTDAVYLQFIENDPNSSFSVGELWSAADNAPTALGERIVMDGGLSQHATNSTVVTEIQASVIETLTAAFKENRLDPILQNVYGNVLPEQLAAFNQQLSNSVSSGDWSWLPPPEIVSADVLTVETVSGEGVRTFAGAFASASAVAAAAGDAALAEASDPRIFISDALDAQLQHSAYLEEIGHFFEKKLRSEVDVDVDTTGDEGELFRLALTDGLYNTDGTINAAVLASVRSERSDDKGEITLADGTRLSVEFMDANALGEASSEAYSEASQLPAPDADIQEAINSFDTQQNIKVFGTVDPNTNQVQQFASTIEAGMYDTQAKQEIIAALVGERTAGTPLSPAVESYLIKFPPDDPGKNMIAAALDITPEALEDINVKYGATRPPGPDLSPVTVPQQPPRKPAAVVTPGAVHVDGPNAGSSDANANVDVDVDLVPPKLDDADMLPEAELIIEDNPIIDAEVALSDALDEADVVRPVRIDVETTDAAGNITGVKSYDAEGNFLGTTTFDYDDQGKIAAKTYTDVDGTYERTTNFDSDDNRLSRHDVKIESDGTRLPVADYEYKQLPSADPVLGQDFVASETLYENGLPTASSTRDYSVIYDENRTPSMQVNLRTETEFDALGVEAKRVEFDHLGRQEVRTFINIDGEPTLTSHFMDGNPKRMISDHVYEAGHLTQTTHNDTALNSDNGPVSVETFSVDDAGQSVRTSFDEYEVINDTRYLDKRTTNFPGTDLPAEVLQYDSQQR